MDRYRLLREFIRGESGFLDDARVRNGERQLDPPADTRLEAGDVLVLFGATADVQRAEEALLERAGRGSKEQAGSG